MTTSQSFLDLVCEQLSGAGYAIRPMRMMGEAMVYVDDKPILKFCLKKYSKAAVQGLASYNLG